MRGAIARIETVFLKGQKVFTNNFAKVARNSISNLAILVTQFACKLKPTRKSLDR